jgi:uncharacterized membrane protein
MATVDQLLFALKLCSALGSGLIAGAFFAFSTFVMSALARIQPTQGIPAMQSINIVVINPLFLVVFLGTAVASLFLVISSLLRWNQPGAAFLLAGGLLYLVGTFLVTMVFNVPLNDSLAKVDAGNPESVNLWISYVNRWTTWNHVRTVAALAASASFILALCHRAAR